MLPNPLAEPLQIPCPHCGLPVTIDDKTLSRLWGARMKARRGDRPARTRFSSMTEDERKAAAAEASNARWTAYRARSHASIAAPKVEPPKKHSVLESLDALDALLKEGDASG